MSRSGSRGDLGRFWEEAGRSFVRAGLSGGTPVVIAGHDHAVGSWASGVRTPGDRADSLGTAEAVLTVLPDSPAPGPELGDVAAAGMSWVRTVSGRHDAVLAGSASAGAMVAWLVERTGTSVDELFGEVLADITQDPRPTGHVVLPYLSGRQSPAPDPTARLHLPDGLSEVRLTRAVLEGLCLQARWMLTEQALLAGVSETHAQLQHSTATARPLTVLGGPAVANAAWAEVKATVTPEPLRWVMADEPVAAGAALLAATRTGLLGDDVVTLLTAARASAGAAACLRTVETPARTRGTYDRMYDEFVATALRGTAVR